MGSIVERDTAGLIVTDRIRYSSLANIFGFYFAGKEGNLAPPAVRPQGRIIDGNNRSVTALVFGRTPIKVYEAQGQEDLMTKDLLPYVPQEVLDSMNRLILYRTDYSNCTELKKFVAQYDWLKDEKTAKEHVKNWMNYYCYAAQPYPW